MELSLSELEKKAVMEFQQKLKEFAPSIEDLMVFGSKARGDFNQFSDIDILVIVNEPDPGLRRRISDLAYETSLRWDCYLSVKVLSQKERLSSEKMGLPFYKNIQNEGISLWKAA